MDPTKTTPTCRDTPWPKEKAAATFVAVAVIGVCGRVALSQVGYNYDLVSWDIVASLVRDGRSVYANTFRFPYAPPGMYVLATLQWLADALGLDGLAGFHLLVAGFLSLIDVGLGLLLWSGFGLGSACFYLLNPVSILITGYHSQLDNVALLFGFVGWQMLRTPRGDDAAGAYRRSAWLMGCSLAFKHVLFLYPLWVAAQGLGRSRKWHAHLTYLAISYGVFFATFLAYLLIHPESLEGIRQHVFAYRGLWGYGHGLFPATLRAGQHLFGANFISVQWPHYTRLFLITLTLLGLWAARRNPDSTFFVYLAGVTLLTPTIADQYLVIPLLACAAHPRAPVSWLYSALATLCLLCSGSNVGPALGLPLVKLHEFAQLPLLLLVPSLIRRR